MSIFRQRNKSDRSSHTDSIGVAKRLSAQTIALISILFAGAVARPQAQSIDPFAGLSMPGLESLPAPETQTSKSKIAKLIGWLPTGAEQAPGKPGCTVEILEDSLKLSNSHTQRGQILRDFFSKCESALNEGMNRQIGALLELGSINYRSETNPHVRRVRIRLKDGTVLTALLGLKNDSIPRPFVIAQCGLICSIDDTMAQTLLMQLFEDNPFNVMIMGSSTGIDYMKNNRTVKFGGFEEARGLIETAEAIMAAGSSLRSRVSSIHILGQSLGGHAALFSSLYASYRQDRLIRSVTALCPVVDLRPSLEMMKSKGIVGMFYRMEFAKALEAGAKYVPSIRERAKKGLLSGAKTYDSMAEVVFDAHQAHLQTNPFPLKPLKGLHLTDIESFWEINDFKKYLNQISVPLLVLNSDNDLLLLPEPNTSALEASAESKTNTNIQVVRVAAGSHCAQGLAYGWQTMNRILRQQILAHDPTFAGREKRRTVDLSRLTKASSLSSSVSQSWQRLHSLQTFEMRVQESFLRAKFKISDLTHLDCHEARSMPGASLASCYSTIELKIPLTALPFSLSTPNNENEASRLSRWANGHLRWLDGNGQSIQNRAALPERLEIVSWD